MGFGDETSIVVGIDLGGTATRFACMRANGEVLKRTRMLTPATLTDPAEFLAEQLRAIADGRALRGVGIGASGPIDADGIIRNPDTLPAFTGVDIIGELGSLLGVPCRIDNDAVTAALAEYRYGTRHGSSSLLLVTLGTGVGTCLLLHGRPFRGSDGWHPEGGHLGVAESSACYCGRTSCWEQSASRTSLQASAARLVGAGAGEGSTDECARLAGEGLPAAREVFDRYGRDVGEGLATLLGVYRPSDVVIGGSGARYFSLFESAMNATLELTAAWHAPHTVSATVLDDFGGAIGAAVLANDLPDHLA